MMLSSRTARPVALTTGILALVLACKIEPRVPELRHSLNDQAITESNEDLALDVRSQEHLRGALEMLFGTPQHPGYMLLESWLEDEYDPNAGGYDELSEEAFDELRANNAEIFAGQLAAIAEGRLDDVVEPRYAEDMWGSFQDLRAELEEEGVELSVAYDADDDPEWTWGDELASLFEGYYPSLKETAGMYRLQCQHCHGVSGGGDGSTSEFLNPRPRDYRLGKFKFTAVGKARPRRSDLFRILEEGIYTTAMPSFRRFSDAQLHGLVDYVRLLARRGETEFNLINEFTYDEGFGGVDKIKEAYEFVHDKWDEADDSFFAYEGEVPEATPELLAWGRQLFYGAEGEGANCASCHGATGRGDGASALEPDPLTGELVRVKDDWGDEIVPRDLTRGIYRFGRRPVDIYRRIYSGINGTPMPEHFGMEIVDDEGTQRPLDERDVWALVHFVQNMSLHVAVPAAAAEPQGAGH